MSTITLDALHQAVASLDADKTFRGVSYKWAAKNTLDAQWWTFIPFGDWGNFPNSLPNPSPFEGAVQNALAANISDVGDIFIDLSHLQTSSSSFFDDPLATATIIDTLHILLENTARKVTIRYLIGSPTQVAPSGDGFLSALFSAGLPNPENVTVFFGNFSPDFAPDSLAAARAAGAPDLASIWTWLHDLIADLEQISAIVAAKLKLVEQDLKGWIERFLASTVPAFSWNHSKIVAINGLTLKTAGANFWDAYTIGNSWLFDFGMAIDGDAAMAGHGFLNYLWSYVGNPAPTDNTSFCLGNLLSNPISSFAPMQAPNFETSSSNSGTVPALAVGRNGMWPALAPMFSIQMFDALRDFLGNLIATLAETDLGEEGFAVTAFIADRLGDDDPQMRALFGLLDVSPAAWATRYARNFAVGRAQTVLRFTQQKFVMQDLVTQSAAFQKLVADINSRLEIQWDGYFWPLDTMLAFGKALSTFSLNRVSPPALQIVCSYYSPDVSEGYQDSVSDDTFKTRLKGFMRGMKSLGMIRPLEDCDKIVDRHCAYREIAQAQQGQSPHANHAKVAVVDDVLCYVGSDNAYPSYNAEFGLWHGDQPAIQSFVQNYWSGLWANVPIGS